MLKVRKFVNPNIAYSKCGDNNGKIFKEEESIEILAILRLID